MPAWLLPALFAGASALFGAKSRSNQRAEENRRRQQEWQTYQSNLQKWTADQNKKRAVARWVIEQKGWKDKLGPLYDTLLADLPFQPAQGGPNKVGGGFWSDFLGSAFGAVPGVMSTFRSNPAGSPDSAIAQGARNYFYQSQYGPNWGDALGDRYGVRN